MVRCPVSKTKTSERHLEQVAALSVVVADNVDRLGLFREGVEAGGVIVNRDKLSYVEAVERLRYLRGLKQLFFGLHVSFSGSWGGVVLPVKDRIPQFVMMSNNLT